MSIAWRGPTPRNKLDLCFCFAGVFALPRISLDPGQLQRSESNSLGKEGVAKCALLDQLDLTRTPSLVDPGFQRAVHTQDREPALAG